MNPSQWLKEVYMSETTDNSFIRALAGAYFVLARPDGSVRATVRELQEAAGFGSTHTVIKYRDELVEAGMLERGGGSSAQLCGPDSVARGATERRTRCNRSHGVQQSVAPDATEDAASHGVQQSVARGATSDSPDEQKKKSPTPPKKKTTSFAVAQEVEESAPAASASDGDSPRSLQDIIENEPVERFVATVAEFFDLQIHDGHAATIWMNAEGAQGSDEKARRYIAQKLGELADGDYASRTLERILRRDSDQYDGAKELHAGESSSSSSGRDIQATGDTAKAIQRKRQQFDGTDEIPF
jgi:hypothetical protein